ncbi:hypothetical protein A8146_26135 [Mesorhizobium loti]|nr:hypothetical protein A8146_26135 [Mesorhizobium loti]
MWIAVLATFREAETNGLMKRIRRAARFFRRHIGDRTLKTNRRGQRILSQRFFDSDLWPYPDHPAGA